MATIAELQAEVQGIYIGLLGRAADKGGLDYWVDELDRGVLTLENLRANIVNEQAEYAAGQGSMTRAQAVADLYNNLFERAPDAAGLEYWVNGAGKTVNADQLVLALINGAAAADKLTLDNKQSAAIYWTTNAADSNDTDAAKAAVDSVSDAASLEASKTATDNGTQSAGQTFTLTTGADTVTGTAANDTITGVISGTAANVTLGGLDVIKGGAGVDTLTILDDTGGQALPTALQTTDVENVQVRSAGAATINLTTAAGMVGVTTLSSTQSAAATLTAAATTDISVSGATGAISAQGGKNITVTDAVANTAINVGTVTKAAGSVTVTDTKQGTADITVTGGTDVSVTATVAADKDAVAGGDIITSANTGTTTIVQNLTSTGGDAEADDLTAANISATGGTAATDITVTVNATSTAADKDADGDIAIGTVDIVAGTATTTVTATQNATATTVTKDAVAVVKETSVVTFKAIKSGETLIINGLTFTASKDLTAEQAAAAFSNIAEGGTVGGAEAGTGVYTGTFNTAVWSSAAASGAAVTFTAQDNDEADLVFTGTSTTNDAAARIPTQVKTAGTAAVAKDTSANVITHGVVTIDDNATAASVTTVTVDGYAGASSIGGTNATTKLATLNLANAAASSAMVVADTAETVALSLTDMALKAADGAEAGVTFTAAPKTLNITNSGDNNVDLTAVVTETMTVAGSGTLNIADVDLAALKSLTVSGEAGVTMSGSESNTLTSVSTAATTGTVTATIDGSKATYTGGAGVDKVTVATATALTKAIALGAGDDTMTFGAAVATSTTKIDGGEGTDTLSMTVANAAALDGSAQVVYQNFERLTLSDVYSGGTADTQETATINLANLGLASYVTTSGTLIDASDRAGESDILVLDKLAANATVVLTADGLITATLADATGTADVINIAMSSDGATAGGNFTAAGVETVNISVDDKFVDADEDGKDDTNAADTLTLVATSAKTVNISGSADLNLTNTGNTKITVLNAADMTGNLTFVSANNASAATITGGAGDDTLTGAFSGDVLVGGAGKDTLTAGADLATLTGGAGNDTFVMNTATTVNGYATITDLSAGDVINTAATSFVAAKVSLADTAVFQDYANAAVNNAAASAATWFQYGGNTYLVVDDAGAATTSFTNGTDQIIKITGLVDLSTAAFSTTTGDLTILA